MPLLPAYPIIPPPPETVTAPEPSTDSCGFCQRTYTPRRVVNRTARPARDFQATIAAENAVLPVVYGQARVGPKIFAAVEHNGELVLGMAWCHGECDSIVGITKLDGSAAPTSITWTHYLGTTTQTADSTLSAAIAGYTDTLVGTHQGVAFGVCYSVARGPFEDLIGNRFVAEIKGRKVYDPREVTHDPDDASTWAWSRNPALAIGDFDRSPVFGRGRAPDWDDIDALADHNDVVIVDGGLSEARRYIDLVAGENARGDDWIETLREYAGCFVVPEGTVTRFPINGTAAATRSLTDANIAAGTSGNSPSLQLSLRGRDNAPTVVTVMYTDTSSGQWKESPARAKAAGVDAGTEEWREVTLALPGITRYSQAYRHAVERLNYYTLTDLAFSFVTHDEALRDQVGDRVDLTSSRGLTAKPLRILDVSPTAPGRWRVSGEEYQAAVYSEAIESEPTYPDTSLPSGLAAPDVTGLVLDEEVYQLQSGAYSTRIRATWDTLTYWLPLEFYIVVKNSAQDVLFTGVTDDEEWATPAVQEGVTYNFKVYAVTSTGAMSAIPAADTITALGKQLAPEWPVGTVLNGFEVGGEVRLLLNQAAIDVDLWRYEWRYGATGGSWGTANFIDRTDALRLYTSDIPEGTWRFYVDALDSVGNYTGSPKTADILVTTDARAFNEYHEMSDEGAPTLSNVQAFTLGRTDDKTRYVTEDAVAFGTKYTSALGTYTNALATYHSSISSSYTTATWDITYQFEGSFYGATTASALNGSITETLSLSADDISYDDYSSPMSTIGSYRYAYIAVAATTTSTLYVEEPGVTVRITAIPVEETGSATSSATVATSIALGRDYSVVKTIYVQPVATYPVLVRVDNIDLASTPNTFDVYLFDGDPNSGTHGDQVAEQFYWTFYGI